MINKELHVEDVIDIYNDKVESLETKNEYLNTILNQYESNILDLKKEIKYLLNKKEKGERRREINDKGYSC